MTCDVGVAAEGLENELWRRWSAYDVDEATEGLSSDEGKAAAELVNELWRMWSSARVGEPKSVTLTLLHLRQSSFSNPSAALTTSQLILQPFRCFTYVIGTSPTSQLILQPFRRYTYVTGHSTTLSLLHLRHRHFNYVTLRAAHAPMMMFNISMMIL